MYHVSLGLCPHHLAQQLIFIIFARECFPERVRVFVEKTICELVHKEFLTQKAREAQLQKNHEV